MHGSFVKRDKTWSSNSQALALVDLPRQNYDGATRPSSPFIPDKTRSSSRKETRMARFKAKLVALFFRLGPAIKNSVRESSYRKTLRAFEEHYGEIDARTDKEKGILAFHRMFSITGLALFRSIQDEFQSQEESIQTVHDILWKGPMNKMVRFLAFFVRRSKDPFHRYLQIFGPNNEWFFPCPPWEKVSVDLEGGIGWHQRKCPLVDFFKKEGVVELTRVYGDMDERIAELLPEHIELRREKAMCRGDGHCDFLYYRRSPSS